MDRHSPTPQRALVRSASCQTTGAASNFRSQFRRIGTILAALVLISGGIALAVSQNWLPVAVLRPLLFAVPCALILLLCFRGARSSSRPEPTP